MADRFRHILDSLTEEVVIIDRRLRITYANPAWMRRLGLEPDQVIGHHCHQVLLGVGNPCDLELCGMRGVFDNGQPAQISCAGQTRRTLEYEAQITASPVFDPQGDVVEVVHILKARNPLQQSGNGIPVLEGIEAPLLQPETQSLVEVEVLNKVARSVTSTLDLDEALRRGLLTLMDTRGFDRANILLLDKARGKLCLHPALSESHTFPPRAYTCTPIGRGITGWVAQHQQPLRVSDVRQDRRYIEGYTDTLSELCVPLQVGDKVIGVLDVQSSKLNAFSDGDVRLLTTLSSQLSAVIENSRLFAEAQQRVRELTSLMQVSQALNEAKDLDTVLDIVLEEVFALLGSNEGSVILRDPPAGNRLRIVAERGLGQEVVERFNSRPVYTHEGTYRRALSTCKIVEVADTAADPDFLHDVGSRATELTNVPLVTDQGPIGLIAADGLPEDDQKRRLLAALAGMAAVAIEKERLHQETVAHLAEVSTLYTLSTQITSSLSTTSILESIVSILRMTLDCRACSIFLINPTREYLQLEVASGPSVAWKGVARLRIGEGISGRVITQRRSIYIPDTQQEPDFIFFDPQIRSLLVVPLIVRGEAIGTLSIDDTKPNAFDKEIRLLTIAAAQAAVAIENAQLYESLQSSYKELQRTFEELRQLDRMKSELIQNISHELRTPLTFIKGYVELLRDGEMGELLDDQQSAIEIVAKKAEALSRLVDDIISMLQAGREQVKPETISLAKIGHDAVQAAQPSAKEAGLSLVDEIPAAIPPVMGDEQRLAQVFDNLLQNAIKFSNPGGTITVRMNLDDNQVRTEVQDTGIGIPADQLPRVFDRFYQVDGTTTRRFGGAGLGLAIVKQIVEAHGGQVGVESEEERGSLFHFTLPKAKTNTQRGGR
jgi:PAS domain S-box-containing protein